MRRFGWGLVAVILICVVSARAQILSPILNDKNHASGGAYTGLCDAVTCSKYWSVTRAATAAYATAGGNAWDWSCSNSGTHTGTVVFASTGGLLAAGTNSIGAAVSTCNYPTNPINITNFYDNIGSLNLPVFTGNATYTANCINTSLPCATFGGSTYYAATSGATSGGINSYSFVADCTAASSCGAAQIILISDNANNYKLGWGLNGSCATVANTIFAYAGNCSGIPVQTASANAFHAVQAVFNSSSSIINVDGSDGTSANVGNNAASTQFALGSDTSANFTGTWTELAVDSGAAWTSGNRASAHSNQSAYYATP